MWSFVTGFFHLVWYFQGSSTLWHASVIHSFLWLSNIPLYGCPMFYLFTPLLMDIWVVSTFWLLWTVLLWTCMYLSVFLTCIPGASERVVLNKYWLKEWLIGGNKGIWLSRVGLGGHMPSQKGRWLGEGLKHQPWKGTSTGKGPEHGAFWEQREASGRSWGSGDRKPCMRRLEGEAETRTTGPCHSRGGVWTCSWGSGELWKGSEQWSAMTWFDWSFTRIPQWRMDSESTEVRVTEGRPERGLLPTSCWERDGGGLGWGNGGWDGEVTDSRHGLQVNHQDW